MTATTINGTKKPGKKFAGALAKILSAGQKETEMTGVIERHQIINTPKIPYKQGTLPVFAWRLPIWHRRC
ncbi:MAG: hypothetical protein ACLP2Y_04330 [Limisphaerales bacterium]